MITIVAVRVVNMSVCNCVRGRGVGVLLVVGRRNLVVNNGMINGCHMMHYLMAIYVLIGRCYVTILIQVFHMFFVGPVSSTHVVMLYLFFWMHLVRRMMAVFMRLKLLHPSGCGRVVLGMVRLFERMRLDIFCFILKADVVVVFRIPGMCGVNQFSVVVNSRKVLN